MRCNICGCDTQLTDDHVPPKFWNNSKIKYYNQGLGTVKPEERATQSFPWRSSKGIVFHSICEKCNNDLLGNKTDKALKELIDRIKNGLKNIQYSHYLNCNIQVNRVARAVVGHMLASKEYYDDQTITDTVLRDFFLDPRALPPNDMHLFYFFYPYDYIVIARDVVPFRLERENDPFVAPTGSISCIYSYPIAFLLSHGDESQYFKLKDMFSYCTDNIDEKKEILFDFSTFSYPTTSLPRHFAWPINISTDPDGAMGVMGGESAQSLIIAKGFK